MSIWFLIYLSFGGLLALVFAHLMSNPPEYDPNVEDVRLVCSKHPVVAVVVFATIVVLWPMIFFVGKEK